MATLTLDTRSTRIDLVRLPRPAAALSDARGSVIVSGRGKVFDRLPGQDYALAALFGPSALCGASDVQRQPLFRRDALINQSKSIKSIDMGRSAAKHDGMGGFVTSLGSRPPSPPV